MSFSYNHAKHILGLGSLDLSSDDLRVLLVMSNTTADTEDNVTTISGITTLDEYDGTGYARQALTGEAYSKDAANNRSEFTAAKTTFPTLGAGTRQCVGALVYKHVTDDTDSIPIAFVDAGGFPFDGTGTDVDITWNAEGLLQIAA